GGQQACEASAGSAQIAFVLVFIVPIEQFEVGLQAAIQEHILGAKREGRHLLGLVGILGVINVGEEAAGEKAGANGDKQHTISCHVPFCADLPVSNFIVT